MQKLGDAIGTIANIAGVLSIPGNILADIQAIAQLFNGDDNAKQLSEIVADVRALLQFSEEEASHLDMLIIETQMEPARGVYKRFAEQGAQDPLFDPKSANDKTFDLVDLLSRLGEFWKRPFLQNLTYFDSEFGNVSPTRFPSGEVFDYRITLPALMEAVAMRLAILPAVRPNFITDAGSKQELIDSAAALIEKRNIIVAGFVNAPIPTLENFFFTYDGLGEIGVVDSYAGSGVVDFLIGRGFLARIQNTRVPDPTPIVQYQRGVVQIVLGIQKRRKALYMKIGLDAVWSSLKNLQRLAGQIDDTFDPNMVWSFWEVHDILTSPAGESTGFLAPDRTSPKLSLRGLLSDLHRVAGELPEKVMAFRGALDRATF
jgi:hypothetical protein